VQGAAGAGARFLVDVVGIGTLGVAGTGGGGDGVGAAAAAQWFPTQVVALRLGAGVLGGTVVPKADAATLYLLGTAGVALHPVRARLSRPFGLSLRVDYVGMRQSISHFDRWLSGVEGVVEGDWLFTPDVEVVLGLGLADMFAPTNIYVQGQGAPPVATIPPLRAVAEAGFRLRF
jgi:hypothetical protein